MSSRMFVDDSDSDGEDIDVSVKSKELFDYCDLEEKGYLTRSDLYKLKNELPLTNAQLDEVFVTLDVNHDDKLELREFAAGFGMFMSIATSHPPSAGLKNLSFVNGRSLSPIKELANDPYDDFLERIGCKKPFKNNEVLRTMWQQIVDQTPTILPEFEEFLVNIATDLEAAKINCFSLQSEYQMRNNKGEKHLRQMYEGIEKKMTAEKTELMVQESANSAKLRNNLEHEVKEKTRQLTEIRIRHDMMKDKLHKLKDEEESRREENLKLQKERDELERKLKMAETIRKDIEVQYKELNEDCLKTKKKHEKSVAKVSSSLSVEEENLAAEIEGLKCQNKDLLDTKDIKSKNTSNNTSTAVCKDDEAFIPLSNAELDEIQRRGSSLYEHLHRNPCLPEDDDIFELDFEKSFRSCELGANELVPVSSFRSATALAYSFADSDLSMTWKVTCQMMVNVSCSYKKNWKVKMKSLPGYKQQLVYPDVHFSSIPCQTRYSDVLHVDRPPTPPKKTFHQPLHEKLFKVIFIGDCGVGKTSFIQRFCDNTFRSTFQATIGIDFQEKQIVVDGKETLLQIWDTAGQERFRSICQQYFRNVNAAVVMYDTTSEQSFKNVRRWMNSIYDCADEKIVVLLIGNKIDIQPKQINTTIGMKLAKEYGVLFFETSAKNGTNVTQAMDSLAKLLDQNKFQGKQSLVSLQNDAIPKKKRWC